MKSITLKIVGLVDPSHVGLSLLMIPTMKHGTRGFKASNSEYMYSEDDHLERDLSRGSIEA